MGFGALWWFERAHIVEYLISNWWNSSGKIRRCGLVAGVLLGVGLEISKVHTILN